MDNRIECEIMIHGPALQKAGISDRLPGRPKSLETALEVVIVSEALCNEATPSGTLLHTGTSLPPGSLGPGRLLM
jgi:hypothetical protein